MARVRFWVCLAVACGLATSAMAQNPAQAPTTVQLPTFSFFTVQTSVSVPDRGGAYLGGINSARDGSMSRGFGPLRNRGSERGASMVSVHATIIDLREIDEAILAEAAAMRSDRPGPRETDIKAELLRRHVGRSGVAGDAVSSSTIAAEPLPGSVAAIRAQNAAAHDERAHEAADLFARGLKAEGEGKPGVARAYYKMVVARNAGDISAQALSRIAVLDGNQKPVTSR